MKYRVIENQKAWLGHFGAQYLRMWEQLLRADEEAALCEAMVREIIESEAVRVEPNADLTGKTRQPDFRCVKNSSQFYVEVTCVHKTTLTDKTGLPPPDSHGPVRTPPLIPVRWQGFLEAVFSECRGKTRQCANLEAPCLVAVGTFHAPAAMTFVAKRFVVEQLLTGETKMGWEIDVRSGQTSETYPVTDLWPAAFVKPDQQVVTGARCPISGMLVCGFGVASKPVYGLLHPEPVRPFDRTLLPRIEFCRLKPGYRQGSLETEWI
jgi:hypothetical protein